MIEKNYRFIENLGRIAMMRNIWYMKSLPNIYIYIHTRSHNPDYRSTEEYIYIKACDCDSNYAIAHAI